MTFFRKYRTEILTAGATTLLGLAMLIWGAPESLDQKLFYTRLEAQFFIDSLRPEARLIYFRTEMADFAFLSLYTALFYLLARRLTVKSSVLRYYAFVPGLFDLSETMNIFFILSQSVRLHVPPYLALLTFFKWLTVMIFLISLAIAWIRRPRGAVNT